jgi:hypothetical protein
MSIKRWLEIGRRNLTISTSKFFQFDHYLNRKKEGSNSSLLPSDSANDVLGLQKEDIQTQSYPNLKKNIRQSSKKNVFLSSKTNLVKSFLSIGSEFPLGRISLVLLCIVFLLFVLGLVMVFDTSAAEIIDLGSSRNIYSALVKQILFAFLGLLLGFGVWVLGYHNILKLSFPLLCFFTFLLILVFIPGIGVSANGARRWVGFAGFSIQPSEFVKYLIPIYYTSEFLKTGKAGLDLRGFLKIIGKIAVPIEQQELLD